MGLRADTTWLISGKNSGTTGNIAFLNVENFQGAADNKDEFIFSTDGSLSGVADGGNRRFDILVIDGGNYTNSIYTASSPYYPTLRFWYKSLLIIWTFTHFSDPIKVSLTQSVISAPEYPLSTNIFLSLTIAVFKKVWTKY